MKTQPNSPIVVAIALLLGFTALAVARDGARVTPEGRSAAVRTRDAGASPLCPPSACTIVFKTESGGPPSRVVHIE